MTIPKIPEALHRAMAALVFARHGQGRTAAHWLNVASALLRDAGADAAWAPEEWIRTERASAPPDVPEPDLGIGPQAAMALLLAALVERCGGSATLLKSDLERARKVVLVYEPVGKDGAVRFRLENPSAKE